MHPPSRTRRIFKWIGVGSVALISVAWAFASGGYVVHVNIGQTGFVRLFSDAYGGQGPRGGFISIGTFDNGEPREEQWFVIRDKWQRSIEFGWPQYEHCWFSTTNDQGDELDESLWTDEVVEVFVPLWLLFIATAIPTAWLWHRDRRRIRPGCCLRCGYDLTGNTSGVCSECGEKAQTAKPPPAISQ